MLNHRIVNRLGLASLCNSLGITDAIEIGTHQGVYASQFMSVFNGTITLVDPWTEKSNSVHGRFYPQSSEETKSREEDMQVAIMAMSKYEGRYAVLRSTGHDALLHFSDKSVGFVYIDAMHDYESVRSDIRDWWPKISHGGILAGHDYQEDCHPGVVKAVNEHAESCGYPLNTTTELPASWWIRKE